MVDKDTYQQLVKGAILFLQGRQNQLIRDLTKKMLAASKELRFEEAAQLRDQIESIRRIIEKQKISGLKISEQDTIGIAMDENQACIATLMVREGRIVDTNYTFLKISPYQDSEEVLTSFIKLYYGKTTLPPARINLPEKISEKVSLEAYLSEKKGKKVMILNAKKGKQGELLRMAEKNALYTLNQASRLAEEDQLRYLTEALNLPKIPERIEAFDVSNIGGKEACGSMVVFKEGRPHKEDYRRYKIKTVDLPDDPAMIKEVIRRRYERLIREEKRLPDLIVVDGGKSQLSSAYYTLKDLGLESVPLISIAKPEDPQDLEKIFMPSKPDPVELPKDSSALRLLLFIRDEAHRFAIGYHRKLRKKLG
jgi:excinuclease ABC subunit C